MKVKKLISAILACVMVMTISAPQAFAAEKPQNINQAGQTEAFFDDFSGNALDTGKWLVAEKMWGGWNGGVVPENVSVSSGTLKLEGHGNLYTGDVQGCNKNLPGGIRTGAAIATRDYYASGCYEVVAKVAPVFGACSAIWTFEYEEYDKDSEEYKNYPDQTGKLAIVNHEIDIELPTANGLKQLAPCKSRHTILSPMRQIQNGITENQNELMVYRKAPKFVPAGQSTQMIIGATPENDYQIMRVSEALYEKFHLKRVFYSAFINVNGDSSLPVLPGGPPLLREHRLYQADWLLRYYRFHVDELLSEDRPNFNIYLDPKCDWALRHLDTFPVEINRASYQTLLRVPGIGYKSAQRIVAARRDTALTYDDLKKIGVVLKRALYFITCSGQMMYRTKLDEDYICSHLMADHTQVPTELRNTGYQQLSLFDTGLAL